MQPLDLVSRAVAEIRPYLPQAARPGVRLGEEGAARSLFVVIERAVRLYQRQAVLHDFVADPYGRAAARLAQTLREIVHADPMLASDIQVRLDALLGRPVPASGQVAVSIAPTQVVPRSGMERVAGGQVATAPGRHPYASMPNAVPTFLPPPATVGDRFLARLIDSGLLFGALVVLGMCGQAVEGSAQPVTVLLGIVTVTAVLGYEFYATGRYGTTVGKHVMKLRIVTLTGAPIGWGAAAARSLLPMPVNVLTCGILGNLFYLSPLFDSGPYKRGWLDQIAGTVVVRDG